MTQDPTAPIYHRYGLDPQVAQEYDDDFADCELFVLDTLLLETWFGRPGRLIDLGCGTGRHVTFFTERDFEVVGVDRSEAMLAVTAKKLRESHRRATLLPTDLIQWATDNHAGPQAELAPGSFDYAICMFSTLGLIPGHDQRLRFLRVVRGLLKPGGQLVLHVHNYGYNIWSLEGWGFLITNALRTLAGRSQLGDKYLTYHRRWTMYLHAFRRREIIGLLRQAGFKVLVVHALNPRRNGFLPRRPWRCLRANGYILRTTV